VRVQDMAASPSGISSAQSTARISAPGSVGGNGCCHRPGLGRRAFVANADDSACCADLA
jgi:hypothetical protein